MRQSTLAAAAQRLRASASGSCRSVGDDIDGMRQNRLTVRPVEIARLTVELFVQNSTRQNKRSGSVSHTRGSRSVNPESPTQPETWPCCVPQCPRYCFWLLADGDIELSMDG